MKPKQTGLAYDNIAAWWDVKHRGSGYGVEQLKRAISWVKHQGKAMDVGCGSSGRFVSILLDHGFQVEGIDVSEEMITRARDHHPECKFEVIDVATWKPDSEYDLISAWDSTFHLPLDLQEPALRTMCGAVAAGGVLIFTCGGSLSGSGQPEEISGSFQGEDLEYSSLGVARYLCLLADYGLTVRHVEYDQGPTEPHVYIIAQKPGNLS